MSRNARGVPVRVKSYSYDIIGDGHVYIVQTELGKFLRFVSDANPSQIVYIDLDDVKMGKIDGLSREELTYIYSLPPVQDYSPQTEALIKAQQNKVLESEAYNRCGSLARTAPLPPNSKNLQPRMLDYKTGPWKYIPEKQKNFNDHRKVISTKGAKGLFNNKGLTKKGWFWGGRSRKTRRHKKRQTRKSRTRKI